ncbi:uncharacterized protein G2W53_022270 [Senna tora]|uniref:Uncharacterized protein n=1 Tax=Senna tora TaxID=362788 RepID=A0A834TND7_9FABA|nr:uncharacterized protein G2W53_022270 [Senna tora]
MRKTEKRISEKGMRERKREVVPFRERFSGLNRRLTLRERFTVAVPRSPSCYSLVVA